MLLSVENALDFANAGLLQITPRQPYLYLSHSRIYRR